jgi:hypothetical protein
LLWAPAGDVELDKVICTAEYSAANDNLPQLKAAQMLDSINQSRTAMRAAVRAYCGLFVFSAIYWLWFAVFAAVPLILSGFYIR